MFANVDLVLLERPQALVIPREAVLEGDREMSVFVVESKQPVRKLITIGYEQDRMVGSPEGSERRGTR